MLISILYRSGLWKKLDIKSRAMRIIILGIAVYIFLHSYINSKWGSGNELLQRYKKWLYYGAGMDLALTIILIRKSKQPINTKTELQQQILQQLQLSALQQPQMQSQLPQQLPQQMQSQLQMPQQMPQQLPQPDNDSSPSIQIPVYQKEVEIPIYESKNTTKNIESLEDFEEELEASFPDLDDILNS